MKNYYAVKNGRIPGIYKTWDECKEQVSGFSGAEYKGFKSLEDAKKYISASPKSHDSDSFLIAYVDGSYSKDTNMFSYGAVLFSDGKKYEFSKAFDDPELATMHNVAGEIKGSEFVMQYCIDNNIKSVDIYYDYQGIEKWCTGEWKTNKTGTQKYREFYQNVSKKVSVNFIKVKGHSGDEYNDLADKLAKSALNLL